MNTLSSRTPSPKRVFFSARAGVRDLALQSTEKHKVPPACSHNEESLCSLTALEMTLFEIHELPLGDIYESDSGKTG